MLGGRLSSNSGLHKLGKPTTNPLAQPVRLPRRGRAATTNPWRVEPLTGSASRPDSSGRSFGPTTLMSRPRTARSNSLARSEGSMDGGLQSMASGRSSSDTAPRTMGRRTGCSSRRVRTTRRTASSEPFARVERERRSTPDERKRMRPTSTLTPGEATPPEPRRRAMWNRASSMHRSRDRTTKTPALPSKETRI